MNTENINPHELCNKKCRYRVETESAVIEHYIKVDYLQHCKDWLRAYTDSLWIRTKNKDSGEYQFEMFLEPFAYDPDEFRLYNNESKEPLFEIITDEEWDTAVNEIMNHYKQIGLEEQINEYFQDDDDDLEDI